MSHAAAVALAAGSAVVSTGVGLGLLRAALRRPILAFEDLALAMAWIFPIGAAVWFAAYLSGTSLLGFGAPWTWLTAAHFLVAGFGALILSAWLARTVHGTRPKAVMAGVLIGHPVAFAAVGGGIAGVAWLDEVGSVLYEVLFVTQAAVYFCAARPHGSRFARGLLGVALVVPTLTLIPAMGWAWGRPPWGLDEMALYHGVGNAVGHVILGLVALTWLAPSRRSRPLAAPLSRLSCKGRVRPDVLREGPGAVRGLTDDLHAYCRPGFDTASLHSDIVAFYEDTQAFELDVRGYWHRPFRLAGWLWTRIVAPAMGQLGLPPPGHSVQDEQLTSRIFDVEDESDGRESVRGWVRRWRRSGDTLYVAAYSEHARDGIRYMNIAFVLPWSFNLTSILHLEATDGGALTLSSRHHQNESGDQGVYLVRSGRAWRLPLDETISVYSADAPPEGLVAEPKSVLVARHELWCAGLRYLTMHYQIRRKGS